MGSKRHFLAVPPRWEHAIYGPPYQHTEVIYNQWIESAVRPESVVLEVGPGPPTPYFPLNLRGRAKRVIGVDVDPTVLTNERLDEAYVTDGRKVPLEDGCVDVAVSIYVLEHVEFPVEHFRQIARVLKAGGDFFFLTVNIWHPTVMAYRLLPASFKNHALSAFGKRGPDGENYPVYFRANSEQVIRRLALRTGFGSADIRHREQPPHYFRGFLPFWLPGVLYERMARACALLRPVTSTLYGRLSKPA